MYKIIISAILFITSLIFTVISIPHYDLESQVLIAFLSIFVGGIAIGYFLSSWSKKAMVGKFKESIKISFGIASAIYLAGYLITSFQGLF